MSNCISIQYRGLGDQAKITFLSVFKA